MLSVMMSHGYVMCWYSLGGALTRDKFVLGRLAGQTILQQCQTVDM